MLLKLEKKTKWGERANWEKAQKPTCPHLKGIQQILDQHTSLLLQIKSFSSQRHFSSKHFK